MTEPTLQDELYELRVKLDLSRHAMAELLYTHQQTYRGWEEGARPHKAARERIRRFIDSASKQITALGEHGIYIEDLVPLNIAAAELGVPVESLFRAYRENLFHGEDLGILGVWVCRSSGCLARMLAAVTE